VKEPIINDIIQWVQKNKKSPCSNCKKNDFTLSDKFALINQVDFGSPQHLASLPTKSHKVIVLICKNCGKIEWYDSTIAGFATRL